jgi:DNA-binding GntR family transcriptional regulator
VNYTPAEKMPDLEQHLPDMGSLFELYRIHYNINPRRVKDTFSADYPSAEEMQTLQINAGTPVMRVRSTLADKGVYIQYSESCYRGDLTRLSIKWTDDEIMKESVQIKGLTRSE